MPTPYSALLRQVVWVRLRNQRLHLLLPRGQIRRQLRAFARLLGREVLRLPDILAQRVQFLVAVLEEADEPPVAFPRRGARRASAWSVKPGDHIPVERGAGDLTGGGDYEGKEQRWSPPSRVIRPGRREAAGSMLLSR